MTTTIDRLREITLQQVDQIIADPLLPLCAYMHSHVIDHIERCDVCMASAIYLCKFDLSIDHEEVLYLCGNHKSQCQKMQWERITHSIITRRQIMLGSWYVNAVSYTWDSVCLICGICDSSIWFRREPPHHRRSICLHCKERSARLIHTEILPLFFLLSVMIPIADIRTQVRDIIFRLINMC